MEYLYKLFGMKTDYEDTKIEHLPNYIVSRYRLCIALLDGYKVVFVYPKDELEQVQIIKKHLMKIKEISGYQSVLILKNLTSRQRDYLLRERIPFVVENKQVYLPFMAIYLPERCDAQKSNREDILPSAQMLLLHFIYNGSKELSTSQAAIDLKLSPMSISRASKQLEEMGLIKCRKEGVQKILYSEDSFEELFKKSKEVLQNPVKKTVYVPKELVDDKLLESSYTALAERSMINDSGLIYYATDKISDWSNKSTSNLEDSNKQVAVEMWRYDPKKLSNNKEVDELSLALSLKDNEDERVQDAVDEMLDNVWRNIDGNRNR